MCHVGSADKMVTHGGILIGGFVRLIRHDVSEIVLSVTPCIISCGATQYMVLCVRMSVRCPSFLPVSGPNLQNYIHQTYASANLLLAMLWFGWFASCRGLESPIHLKRLFIFLFFYLPPEGGVLVFLLF